MTSFSYRMQPLQTAVSGLNGRATDAAPGSLSFYRDAVDERRYDPDFVSPLNPNIEA